MHQAAIACSVSGGGKLCVLQQVNKDVCSSPCCPTQLPHHPHSCLSERLGQDRQGTKKS